jgi:hypothetical protein
MTTPTPKSSPGYTREEFLHAYPHMQAEVERFEKLFKIHFTHCLTVPRRTFEKVQNFSAAETKGYQKWTLQPENSDHSESSEKIRRTLDDAFAVFADIANRKPHEYANKDERREYLSQLLEVYQKMQKKSSDLRTALDDATSLVIAPKREGSILAREMGWDQLESGFVEPDAKRIHFKDAGGAEDGLVVGLSGLEIDSPTNYKRAVLVDGAIASGATLNAIIKLLRTSIKEFHIVCVHATEEGLKTFQSYVEHRKADGITVQIHAGRVCGKLSSHYYAIEEDPADNRRNRLIVGDLGDTIDGLDESEK